MSSSCPPHDRLLHHTTPYHITPSLRTIPHHTTPRHNKPHHTTPHHNKPQYVPAFSRQSITPPFAAACILTALPISESLHCFTPLPHSHNTHTIMIVTSFSSSPRLFLSSHAYHLEHLFIPIPSQHAQNSHPSSIPPAYSRQRSSLATSTPSPHS